MTGNVKVGKDCSSILIVLEEQLDSLLDNPAGLLGQLDFKKSQKKPINVNLPLSVQVKFQILFRKFTSKVNGCIMSF